MMDRVEKDRCVFHILKQPVFVRFLIFGFFGGEFSLLTIAGDGSRGLKSSALDPSGAILTASVSGSPWLRRQLSYDVFED